MKIICTIFLSSLFFSCVNHFDEKELYGFYSPNYTNNFDTIQLEPKGVYHRRVFDKNKKLLLEMSAKWHYLDGHRIVLNSFYQNLNDDLIKFPESVFDTTMEVNVNVESHEGTLRFCVGHIQDGKNCFHKIIQ